jgi:hypothetical protein
MLTPELPLRFDYELAIRLGKFILKSGTEDKQILAMGHKLSNLDEDEDSQVESGWTSQSSGWNIPRHSVTEASFHAGQAYERKGYFRSAEQDQMGL